MPRTTAFDDELAAILGRIRASGTGIEEWVNPLLNLQPTTPEEEEEKTGILSTIGSILHEPKRRVDIALNYYANDYLRDRVMRGEEPIPAGTLAKEAYIAPPEAGQSPTEQHLRSAGRGLMERWIDVSTDPVMFALPPIMRGAPAILRTAAGLGFAGTMAKSAIEQADATYESYKREGWSPTTSEEAAKTAFDVGLLGTMAAGFFPKRRPPTARRLEPAGEVARRPPIPTRPIPGQEGIPYNVYEQAQSEYLRGRPLTLPEGPGAPPPGAPTVTVEPPPPPEPAPLQPRLPEVNAPQAPERMADAALLGQIQEISRAIGRALSRGDIDGAQELRGHYSRLTDVYRTRRYSPEARIGRLGDLMQQRDILQAERDRGPGIAREMEINESLAVLDAEINLARSAQQVPPAPTAEAPPPAPPGAPAPAAPPPAAPAPAAPPGPPGPIPSRSPHAPGPGAPVQELIEGAQAEVTGIPASSEAPLAQVVEGGEPAGMAARAGAGRPAPAPLPGMPGGPPLDVEGIVPSGPPGGPRLGAVAPIYPHPAPVPVAGPGAPPAPLPEAVPAPPPAVQTREDEEAAAAEAVDAFLAEQGLAEAPPPEEPSRPPAVEKALGKVDAFRRKATAALADQWLAAPTPEERPSLGALATAAGKMPAAQELERALESTTPRPEAPPKKRQPPTEARRAEVAAEKAVKTAAAQRKAERDEQAAVEAGGTKPIDTLPDATKALRPAAAAQKAGQKDVVGVGFDGKPYWSNGHLVVPSTRAQDRTQQRDMSAPIRALLKDSIPAEIVGWQQGYKGATPVWFKATKGRKTHYAAVDGDYFRTLNKIADREAQRTVGGVQWRMTPAKKGRTPQAVTLVNLTGTRLLGMVAPLNEEGPPPPMEERPAPAEPKPEITFKEAAIVPTRTGVKAVPLEEEAPEEAPAPPPPPAPEPEPLPMRPKGRRIRKAVRQIVDQLEDTIITKGTAQAHLRAAEAADVDVSGIDIDRLAGEGRTLEGSRLATAILAAPRLGAGAEEIESLKAEQARLREERAQQLAAENEALRAELEETREAEVEAGAVGIGPEEELPGPGEGTPAERRVGAVPPEEAGDVGERVPERGPQRDELRAGERAGVGRGAPEGEPSVTTQTPTGLPVNEIRADGETRTVEPAPKPPPAPKLPSWRWDAGRLSDSEGRGLKDKAGENLAAIRILKAIETADRGATPAEQETLAKYVGWGGMPRVFKEYDYGTDADFWMEQHKSLKELLTPEEYESARASVTNAHYTREEVIRAMWGAVAQMGGRRMMRVLEPSMGVGNFISSMPGDFRPAHVTGVELDPVTGRIAKALFPNDNIRVGGFESTPTPEGYYDLAISNVPFGPFGVSDPAYRDQPHLTKRIHNYFFAKALDKLRPGGVLAFVTSHGTMDAKDTAFREHMAENAWFLGGVRLPRTTFQRNANTGVTTDVLFFQKAKPGDVPSYVVPPDQWTGTVAHEGRGDYGQDLSQPLNAYFAANPTMVLGDLAFGDGTAGPTELTVSGDFDLGRMTKALEKIGGPDVLEPPAKERVEPPLATADQVRTMKPGNFNVDKGKVWILQSDSTFADAGLKGKAEQVAKDWVPLRDAAREVIAVQLERGTDAALGKAQKKLNQAYDRFTGKHGPLHGLRPTARKNGIELDPEYPLTLALEEWSPPKKKGRKTISPGKATKREIFRKRTVYGYEPPSTAGSPREAFQIALSERGRIDVERIAGLLDVAPSDALGKILGEGLAFEDPVNGNMLVPADEYLSGNVREKLDQAKAAAELHPDQYGGNVKALEAVQPEPLTAAEISVQLGAAWVPAEVYAEFAATELGGVSPDAWKRYRSDAVTVRHSEGLGLFKIDWDDNLTYSAAATTTYGTSDVNAFDLFEKAMNLRSVVVRKGSGDERRVDPEATALAQDKMSSIKERFSSWVWQDTERATALLEIYNRDFNNNRLRQPDGTHLQFPGINQAILRDGTLAPHQKNDVWRILTQPNTLIAEPVGSGKTFTLAAAMMEARRTGQIRKPLLAVPNAIFEQWASEWPKLYPQAKLLIVEPNELTGKKRAVTMSRIATEEWDGILVTHEALKRLPVSSKAMEQIIREEMALLDQTVRELAEDMEAEESIEDFVKSATKKGRGYGRRRMSRADTKLVKEIEKQKERLKSKLKKLYENAKRDKTVAFDELGVDMLVVDESHYFNNLYFPTKLGRVKGIGNVNSDRAFDLYVKVRTLQRMNGGKGVVFSTATPVRNTLAEMYTLFRYLGPDFLRARGLRHFDDWVRAFAEPRSALALNPTGSGYRTETRFSAFVNVPELLTAFRNITAVMTPEDLKLPVPEIALNKEGKRLPNFVEFQPSDQLREFVDTLNLRAQRIKDRLVEPEEDNMLLVTTDGRKAALDLALVGRRTEPEPDGKLAGVAQKVYDIWKRTTPTRGVQAVFLDLSTPQSQPFSAYRWLKERLVEMGVPAEEIDFVHNYDRKTRQLLFDKLNDSQVRIVEGSTKKMGVGANFQKNVVAMHNVDIPWTPDGLEQRNGRGVRQGNVNPEVEIHNYVTKGTFDAYMWQLISTKSGFIGQVMTGKASARRIEDVSLTYLTAQEALAATSENPLVVKKIQLEADVRKYERLLGAFQLEAYQTAERRARWQRSVEFQKSRAKATLDALGKLGPRQLEVFSAPVTTLDQGTVAATFDKMGDEAGTAVEAQMGQIAKGLGSYYIGRFRGFGILVRKHPDLGTDVALPTPGTDQGVGDSIWRARWGESGVGLLRSIEQATPKESDAEQYARAAVTKEREIEKLGAPTFKYQKELDAATAELAEVNADLKTEADDAAATATDAEGGGGKGDGGDYDEDIDYEGGETGAARDEDEADVVPPAAAGGGAGGRKPPRKPPSDEDSTPDGMGSDGPQPGEDGWQRRVNEAKARNRKRARGGQTNAGVDPQHMADIAVEGADLAWRGARTFAAWSRAMMRTLGRFVPGLKRMLRGLWNWVQQMFRGRGRGPQNARGPRRARPDFEEYRAQYEEATAGQRGAGRRRYPWEEREIPPEEVRQAAEEGARYAEEPPPEYGKPPAADINFDRIGGEPDIRAWQAKVVESLRPRWGRIRSFRTWKEARQAAVEAGLTERDFIRLVKERGAVTDIEIEAGRMMRQEAAESAFAKLNRLEELRQRRATERDPQAQRRLDEEIMEADREYRDALARFSAVTASTVEAAAEVARALNIHRKMAEAITPEERVFRQLLRKVPNMSEKLRNELADAVMRRDAQRIREIARKINAPSPLDYATEWFVNSLLSGLTTLEVNVLGNLSFEALFRTPERGVAAGIEATGARQWVERIFGKDPLPRQRFGREFEEGLRRHIETRFGMMRALKYAWEFLTEEPGLIGAKAEYRVPAFKGALGKVVRTPSRMMYALDLGSRWAAMEAELAVQSVRRAIMESRKAGGWTRDQVTSRMREHQDGFRRYMELEQRRKSGEVLSRDEYRFLSKNGMYGRWQTPIRDAGAKATFTDRADRFTAALMQMREAHPWMTFFAPFIRTPSRILAAALHRSPYAAYDVFRKASKGELAGGELSDAMARVVWGNMIGAGMYLLAREGFITGSGPADPRERSTLMKTGWRPYSVKVGDAYVSMARLEPFGTHLGWAADLAEIGDAKSAGEVYDKLVQGISLNIVNKTYLQGPIGLAEALGDPERYGANLGRKTLGAFVPNLLAQAARAIDPNVRETDTIAGTLLARVPILSKSLPTRRRGTGEPLVREEHPLSRWLSPFRYGVDKGPEANLERIFLDVGYIPSNAPREVTVPGTGGRKVKLIQAERDLYGQFKERATRFARTLAQNEQFLAMDPWVKEEMLKRIYRYAHDAAHRAMVASAARRADTLEWVE